MIRVYFSQSNHRFSAEVTDRLSASLLFDPTLHLSRFSRWQDAQSHLIGRLLLARGFASLGITHPPPLRYTDYQRPYLDLPLDFSISHSAGYVLCALADTMRVGVDIEKIRPIELADMQLSFSTQEWAEITTAKDSNHQFFDHWTRKEAVAKADGRGMSVWDHIELNGLRASVEDTHWHVTKLALESDYCAYLASSEVVHSAIPLTRVELISYR